MLLLAARGDDDLVLAMLPAHDLPGAASGEPLRLAAMQASRTTTLALDGLRVGPEQVVDVVPAGEWLALDTARTANVGPAAFGLLATVCRHLVRAAGRPGTAAAADVALQAAEQGSALRQEAYGLLDGVPVTEEVPRRLRLRAETLHLLQSTSGALVAACAGAGMSLDAPAQRLAREALFHLVQAQTGPVREATLEVWAGRQGRS
ncbi:hypothetical protein [Aquipuribacter hungaricus]|uniref:Acyl-CoA dehydrogenase/oxidase C-terminal domain-containing protein n=1 Tax=Aquipuribacter hungaricus TaxID=545624 RepID=A0ABV7WDX9_9MICO